MKKLSKDQLYDLTKIPSAKSMKIGIVVSEWNSKITEELFNGAIKTLIACNCKEENIIRKNVPGSFELPLAAQFFFESSDVDAVICLGSVIKGETKHFEYVCQAVAHGIKDLNINFDVPVIFCVLTDSNIEQAKARSGGKYGNKGEEAAITALRMATLKFK